MLLYEEKVNKAFFKNLNSNDFLCRCPPTGLYDVGPCAKGSPIFVSFPHFLYAERSLQETVDGLTPNESEHEFYFDYEKVNKSQNFVNFVFILFSSQNLAIPMSARIRLQVNLFIKRNEAIEIMADWPENFELYLPQFWSQTVIFVWLF